MATKTVNKYMALITSTEDRADGRRRLYHVGDRFTVEIATCEHDLSRSSDLMNVWKKHGYIAASLPSHLSVSTYYTDEDGQCWGRYNITVKPSDDGRRQVINFDYLREATPKNEMELVAECIRLMVKATGYQAEKPQKRYRDEAGRLTMSVDQIAAETLNESKEYYQDGGQYIHKGKVYTLRRYMDKTADGEDVEVAQFASKDGYNIFTDPACLGTFLPGVASDGMEITRI